MRIQSDCLSLKTRSQTAFKKVHSACYMLKMKTYISPCSQMYVHKYYANSVDIPTRYQF